MDGSSSNSSMRVNYLGVKRPRSSTVASNLQRGGYECKTCGKRFDSFQALGGHQGIHKKVDQLGDENLLSLSISVPKSSGLHRCKICMKGFESGAALGGHMTRHRNGKDLVLLESDDHVMVEVVDQVRLEEEEEKEGRRELILAAKEWRLWPGLGGHVTRHRNGKDSVSMSDNVMVEAVEVGRVKAEKDEEKVKRRELILAAKEWRLWPVRF